jgi:hypothetical protein
MTDNNDGIGKSDKLARLDAAIIKKAIDRLDTDLRAHVYLSGLSLNFDTVLRTISMVSILQNNRLTKENTTLTEPELLNIKTTNTLLATAIVKPVNQKNSIN